MAFTPNMASTSTPDMASPFDVVSSDTGSLLLQLPNELQDAICDMVAEDKLRPVLRILIREDATTGHKHPEVSAFVIGGLSSTCRHLRRLLSATLERHIETTMTRTHREDFPRLMVTTKLHDRDLRSLTAADQPLRIHVSGGPRKKNDKGPVQKVHALAAFVPIEDELKVAASYSVMGRLLTPRPDYATELAIIFVTDGSKSTLLPSRRSIPVPSQPPHESDPPTHWVSLKTMVAFEEVKQAVKGTKWGAKMRYYTLWFDYFVRFGPRSASVRRH
jgi:hypothetical protein